VTLTRFNHDAGRWINGPLSHVPPAIDGHGALLDARLLHAPSAGYAVALSNYSEDPQAPVVLTLRAPRPIRAVHSARAGLLSSEPAGDGAVTVRYAPGLGDILRLATD
jgi:hypothetical protein